MFRQRDLLAAIILLALGLFSSYANASIEVGVSPLRAVLTPDQQKTQIRVSNPSGRIIELRVGWTDLTSQPKGYAPALPQTRRSLSAAPYLSVSPAFFRLEPGTDAFVTVQLNEGSFSEKSDQTSDNFVERRSHLLFSTSAARTPLRKASGGLQADIGLSVSIPVHVRYGQKKTTTGLKTTTATFSDSRLVREDDGSLAMETTIVRSGPYSIFGKLIAEFQESIGRKKTKDPFKTYGTLDNATVHVENTERTFRVRLNVDELPKGILKLSYVGLSEYEGRKFEEKDFSIAAPSGQ